MAKGLGISAKRALRCTETIAFIDETAFRLPPTFHRTWAPMGEAPFVETESSTDPVAVTSAITYTPETGDCELYFRSQQGITNRSCDPVPTSQNSNSENEAMILRLKSVQ